jgi:hypothetical protein
MFAQPMPANNLCQRSLRISRFSKSAVAILILAAGIYLAIRRQDAPLMESFGQAIGLILLAILLLLLAGVVALLNKFLSKSLHRQRIGKAVGWLVVIGSSMILSAILFMATVRGIDHWKFVAAQNYVANAEPILDAAKAHNEPYDLKLLEAKLGPMPCNLTCNPQGNIGGFVYFDEDGEGIFVFDPGHKSWRFAVP